VRTILTIGMLAGALLLSGCGGDDDEPQGGGGGGGGGGGSSTSSAPPEGSVEKTGYSFVPPDGWKDASKAFEGSAIKVDAAYAEPEPEQGFANNVNIIRETPNGLDADNFDAYIEEFRRQAGTQANEAGLSDTEELELDGEPARTWEYESSRAQEPKINQKQVVVIKDDALYTITWTARQDVFEESKSDLQGMLDSWRWSG
jgi:hypothetical protein